jgi:hypothetical protein
MLLTSISDVKLYQHIFVTSTKNGRRIIRASLLCQAGNDSPCNIEVYDSHSNQIAASLLESFLCKLNTFRKRVKNVVTSKGIQVGVECK